jgi:hypothetical protein
MLDIIILIATAIITTKYGIIAGVATFFISGYILLALQDS